MKLRRVLEWFSLSDEQLATSWPRLYIIIRVVVMIILSRIIFLLAGVFYLTFFKPTETQEHFYPANNLSSVFKDDQLHYVYDIYNGSLTTLDNLLSDIDIGVVLLYAPWCSHSLAIATNFVNVAKQFTNSTNIKFVGINCWNTAGACRKTEGTMMYPRIFIHHININKKMEYFGDKTQYGLGLHINKLLYPMVYVTTVSQFDDLLANQESLIIGHFDFSIYDPPGFIDYYLASLLATQTDPRTGLTTTSCFAIVSDPHLSVALSLSPFPSIRYITLRGRIHDEVYEGQLIPNDIYDWSINRSLSKLVKFLVPTDNLSYLLQSPVAILFTPLNSSTSFIISNFNFFAVSLSYDSSHYCTTLKHLLPWQCLAPPTFDRLISLPLCSTLDGYCPVFNPLFPDGYNLRSSLIYCQDGAQVDGVTGGWPPPCHMISLKFYVIDSLRYWGVAESMGVADGYGQSFVVIADFKSNKLFKLLVGDNTTTNEYVDMLTDIVTGRIPFLSRSGYSSKCTQLSNFSNCVYEVTANSFTDQILLDIDHVVIVFHYVPWCLACSQLWPHLFSLSLYNNSIIQLARINGEQNDLPFCHSPSHYPSIALYKFGRKYLPTWFPDNVPINIHTLLDFILTETSISLAANEQEQDQYNEWAGMGWLLWETAEKEKMILEQKNYQLSNEINLLKHKINELSNQNGQRQTNVNDMTSLLSQVDSLVNQLMKTTSSESENGKHSN